MFQPVALPLWLLVLILGFAGVTFASHFLFPSVRWFFRRRAEKALARLNARLDRPIELFKLARRQDMIVRLSYDPKVLEAVTDYAAEASIPPEVAFEMARRYAREIVPSFSATLYFGVAIRLARWLSRGLYRVRVGRVDKELSLIDPRATVVFVMNHRSNMDYVLVTWLVANRSALAYAVGEWARIWPFSGLIRGMGAYFIRRKSRNTLYRRVLARFVQMATEEGTTQAIFPEGGLSLDGRVGAAKLGLLSYIVSAYSPDGRDVVFVPVGLGYDRVLEDRILVQAAASGERRFRGKLLTTAWFGARVLWKILRGRFPGFGTAAAGFGAPVSLRAYYERTPGAAVETLAASLMAEIARVVPVTPGPLVAAALINQPADLIALATEVERLAAKLEGQGAVLRLAPQGFAATVAEGLVPFQKRGLVDDALQPTPGSAPVLAFYAAAVQQRLQGDAATQKT
ncbi:1-acyl-sn-glycerol-3-phosphate acyltransferase [Tabrizicola sp. KVB23]|uniref:Glycerol-3-phosphate acyltransferase n=2 Tax=Fuscibacter oryzae TaxID=2803939 RepID=A0A8J7MT37_9RHOB|nr:1-acyl-sn-glycerol-3-phosphate acyltransferase [Fuscibacter oryzae]